MTASILLLAAVAIATVCAAATAPGATAAVVGGWSPIKDIRDPHIQELGQWAVSENNKVSPNSVLTFSKVTSGEQQEVAGMKYRLHIDASSNDVIGSYTAVVFEQANTRKLVSFSGNRS